WGGQAGYNWQSGPVVAGLELDFSVSNISGISNPATIHNASETVTVADDVKYLGSARARLGYSPLGSSLLLYGTAGLAWERVDRIETEVQRFIAIRTSPKDWFGWVAGAGAEVKLGGSNWIGRLEYLHYDFGKVEDRFSVVGTDPNDPSFSDKVGHQTIEVVRAGLSYKFTNGLDG